MPTPVQTAIVSNANGTQATNANAWGSALTVGNRVIVSITLVGSTNVPSPTVSSINVGTDTLSLVTGAAVSNGSGSTGVRVEVWSGTVVTANQTALTVNASGACNIVAIGGEYAGGTYTITLDGTPQTQTGTSTSPASANLTTANAADLLIFAVGWNLNQAFWTTGPTNSFVAEKGGGASGSGTGKNLTGASSNILNDLVVSATGTYSSSGTIASSVAWATIILAFKQVAVVNPTLPLPLYAHRHVHIRTVIVRPKRRVKTGIFLERIPQAPFPNFPEQVRRQQQKKRIPSVKPTRPHRSELNRILIPPRPFPEMPAEVLHSKQPKRIPRVKSLRPHRSELNRILIPPRPFPEPPAALRHRAQQHRIPRVKAKRRVYGTVLSPPPPLPLESSSIRHRGQPHRLVRVKPKRKVYGTILHSPPQVPPEPLAARRGLAQKKRIPRVKAKRPVRSYVELYNIPAPVVVVPGNLPITGFTKAQRKRIPRVRAKRPVGSSIQLRIPPRPFPELPLTIRHPGQRKRLPRPRPKRRLYGTLLAVVRAPTSIPLPLLTRRLRRLIVRTKPKRALHSRLPIIVAPPNLPLPVLSRHQVRRLAKLKPVKMRTAKGSVIIFTPSVVQVSPTVAIVIWRLREGY